MRLSDIPQLEHLSVEEKILLVEDLWDSIAVQDASVPIPQSHLEELERRMARAEADPGRLLSLEELKRRVKNHDPLT